MKKILRKEIFYKIPLVIFVIFILIKIKPMNENTSRYLKNQTIDFSIEAIIQGAPNPLDKKKYIKEQKFKQTIENKFIKKIYIFDDKKNQSTIYVVETNQGYSGRITYSIAIGSSNSNVIALNIIKHNESRGAGRILQDKNNWISKIYNKSFKSLNQKDWALIKKGGKFDGLSGATITQEALLESISNVIKFHIKNNL